MGEKAGGGLVSPFQQGLDASASTPRPKAALAGSGSRPRTMTRVKESSGQDGISRLVQVPPHG